MGENPELRAMALKIVKAHYPEMPADYRGRRYQIALAAIIETQERDAALAEDHVLTRPDDDHQLGQTEAAQSIAAAIRSGQHYGKDRPHA